jgi:transposase
MQAYSMDLRIRVMSDVDDGMGTNAVASKYRVSADWVRKLKRFRRETGHFGPRQQRVSHATKLDDHLEQLQQLVAEKPDATLSELRAALGVAVGQSTIWRALRRLQFTFKKKCYMPKSSCGPMSRSDARFGKLKC